MLAMSSNNSIVGWLEVAKIAFSVVYVAATIGVLVGVYWERDDFPKDKQERGWRLLVRSLAVDTLFTVLIIAADGWISAIQRNEIAALEMRLAARTLSHSDAEVIRKAASRYAGQKFEVIAYWDDKESLDFANGIADALIASGWQIDQPKTFTTLLGVIAGINVYSDPRSSDKLDVRRALVDALNVLGFSATGKDENPSPNSPVDDKININVGIKP